MTLLRPLYIDRAAAAVRLEGPALIVEQPGCAAGRFPLRLLSRVVARGPVPWSMEALFACLGSGVPVAFLSLHGEVVGLCLGCERPEESLAMLLDRLTAEPDWSEIYGRWRKAAERRAIVEGGAPSGIAGRPRSAAADRRGAGGGAAAGRRRAGRALGDAPVRRPAGGPSRRAARARRRPALLSRRPRLGARPAPGVPRRALLASVGAARALARPAAAPSARRAQSGAPPLCRAIRGRGATDRRALSPNARRA